MTVNVDMKALLENGAHFGHKTSRWHPKMAPYIHSKRGEAHIINLEKTVESLEEALPKITDIAKNGKKILRPAEPFRWSEDFGHYLFETPGAMFGIGAGLSCPQLHTDSYEFPDDICETALDIYAELIRPPEVFS